MGGDRVSVWKLEEDQAWAGWKKVGMDMYVPLKHCGMEMLTWVWQWVLSRIICAIISFGTDPGECQEGTWGAGWGEGRCS